MPLLKPSSAARGLGIAVASCIAVGLFALVSYEALVHRDRDWDDCKIIKVTYAQSSPTSGAIVWNLAIYPKTGAWNFQGTRRLQTFLELPPDVGQPFGDGVEGSETIELKGTLHPDAASGLVGAALERDADVVGRWIEAFSDHVAHSPLVIIELQVDGRRIDLANPMDVPSRPLEDLARYALTLTVLTNTNEVETQSPR